MPPPGSSVTDRGTPGLASPVQRSGCGRRVVRGVVALDHVAVPAAHAGRGVARDRDAVEAAWLVAVVVRCVVLGDPVVEHDEVTRLPYDPEDVLRPGHVRLENAQDV